VQSSTSVSFFFSFVYSTFLVGGVTDQQTSVVIASCIRLKYIFALDTSDPTCKKPASFSLSGQSEEL
jgi:hypothetical protein